MKNLIRKLENLGYVLTIAGLVAAPPAGYFKDFKPINYISAGAAVVGLAGIISSRKLQRENLLGNQKENYNEGVNN